MSKKNSNIVAIVTMIYLFGMISFVTNLAAPVGNIWKQQPSIAGSNALGMMGNMMNFLAYLFMGIPAGKILAKYGSRKANLLGIALGFIGVFIQFLSGVVSSFPANFIVYLIGAFVSGFAVCTLNTVVNPMLTVLGGGGNKGNQLVQVGGTFNSLMGTLTPILVGALVGQLSAKSVISDVNPVLFIAMGVFAVAFVVLSLLKFEDPQSAEEAEKAASPMSFRHFVLGVVAIFIYVGVEVGIPGTLNFFLSDSGPKGAGMDPATAAGIAGFVAGTYWFLILIGRFVSSFISGKVSSRTQLAVTTSVALILVIASIFAGAGKMTTMPVFTGSAFTMANVPLCALLLVLCGLCTSVMWGCIFNLAVEGLGASTAQASGIFMTMVVGGGILPLVQNFIADHTTYMASYWLVAAGIAYMLFYALIGSKPSQAKK